MGGLLNLVQRGGDWAGPQQVLLVKSTVCSLNKTRIPENETRFAEAEKIIRRIGHTP